MEMKNCKVGFLTVAMTCVSGWLWSMSALGATPIDQAVRDRVAIRFGSTDSVIFANTIDLTNDAYMPPPAFVFKGAFGVKGYASNCDGNTGAITTAQIEYGQMISVIREDAPSGQIGLAVSASDTTFEGFKMVPGRNCEYQSPVVSGPGLPVTHVRLSPGQTITLGTSSPNVSVRLTYERAH